MTRTALFNETPTLDVFKTTLFVRKKNKRVIWSKELHQRFLVASRILGTNAIPSEILKLMNVSGLTRLHVASHLQKYKKNLEKANSQPPANETPALRVLSEPLTFMMPINYSIDCYQSMQSTSCGNLFASIIPANSGFCSAV